MTKKTGSTTETHENLDRYLVTYADLITLLLGLFVILYAASQVDETKYKEVSKAFTEYFKAGDKAIKGGKGVLEWHESGIPDPIVRHIQHKSLSDIAKETEYALQKYIAKGSLKMNVSSSGIVLTLPEKLLFESGKAEVQPEGNRLLDSLAVVFRGIQYQITVDGHTDTDPIRTFRFESNWHLSVARALSVGYKLIQQGAPESYMVIRGFGAEKPISDNATAEGKTRNRRVEITISELPGDTPSTTGYDAADTSENKIEKTAMY